MVKGITKVINQEADCKEIIKRRLPPDFEIAPSPINPKKTKREKVLF
jgi:hypothetical protein